MTSICDIRASSLDACLFLPLRGSWTPAPESSRYALRVRFTDTVPRYAGSPHCAYLCVGFGPRTYSVESYSVERYSVESRAERGAGGFWVQGCRPALALRHGMPARHGAAIPARPSRPGCAAVDLEATRESRECRLKARCPCSAEIYSKSPTGQACR